MNKLLEKFIGRILYSRSPLDQRTLEQFKEDKKRAAKIRKVGIKPSALYYLKCLYCNRIRPIKEFNTKKTHTRCTECYNHYMKMVMRERNAAKKLTNSQTDETMHTV